MFKGEVQAGDRNRFETYFPKLQLLNYKMGYASAQSWVLFAIIMVLTIIIFKTSDNWTYYED